MRQREKWVRVPRTKPRHDNADYQEGLNYLESRGFEIIGVVTDGRRGLANVFRNYPYQICLFHIQKGVRTLLTKNPKKAGCQSGLVPDDAHGSKSEAGKNLYLINKTFIKDKLTKQEYLEKIKNHLETHQDYINEMSEIHSANPMTTRTKYKHERHRKALRKIQSNLKYMFVFQDYYSQLKIPKTTNHIDGGLFSPMKKLLKNHNGLSKEHRKTLIIQFCNSRAKRV